MTQSHSVGDPFPEFDMETPDGGRITKADLAGRKAVIFFYPKDNTPGCTTEAKDFSALQSQFGQANVALLGVSKDSPRKHRNFIAKHDLTIDLATDAQENGLSDRLGIWTEKQNYGRTYMGMVRTTYLLGEDGTIRKVWPKVRVKGHAQDVLDIVREA